MNQENMNRALRILVLGATTTLATTGCETEVEEPTYRQVRQAQTGTYTERAENTVNPGRGFINMVHWDPSYQASSQSTTVYRLGLADYCNTNDITAPLASFQVALNQFRAAGKKLILRMVYSTLLGEPNGCGTGHEFEPANYNVLKAHLDQLAPMVAANRDVLAYAQAGTLGPWGEWHGFGIKNTPSGYVTHEDRGEMLQDQQVAWGNVPASSRDNRLTVLRLLMDALPTDLPIQVRRPTFLYEAMHRFDLNGRDFANQHSGQTDSFTDAELGRLGIYNDCFAASTNDYGTYSADYGAIYFPEIDTVAESMAWAETESEGRVLGGETCPAIAWDRMECTSIVPEMERLHWSYLNRNWWGPAMSHWQTQGCYDEIERRMGYRLLFQSASLSDEVDPASETILATATVENVGFAAPLGEHEARFTLTRGTTRLTVGTDLAVVTNSETDPRDWAPGSSRIVSQQFQPPTTPGVYHLALEVADSTSSTGGYSLRFSSNVDGEDVWDADEAENETGMTIRVLGSCVPLTCAEVTECGTVEDGCGATQECTCSGTQNLGLIFKLGEVAEDLTDAVTADERMRDLAPVSSSLRVRESLSEGELETYDVAVRLAKGKARSSNGSRGRNRRNDKAQSAQGQDNRGQSKK